MIAIIYIWTCIYIYIYIHTHRLPLMSADAGDCYITTPAGTNHLRYASAGHCIHCTGSIGQHIKADEKHGRWGNTVCTSTLRCVPILFVIVIVIYISICISYIYIYSYVCTYIYIYIERERDRDTYMD